MGATATGKTALACALAARFPLGLVSVDSTQVYRGFDIGSAKPDERIRARFPHWLIDIQDPSGAYSAARFRLDARAAMAEITAAGRVPLLVGGTGLYFRSLERGLSPMPPADTALRADIMRLAGRLGWPALHAQLAARDPVSARRIRPRDAQRIQRALEVIALTGHALPAQRSGTGERLPWRVLKLALLPPSREQLRTGIMARFDAMLEAGFVEEVRRLAATHPDSATLPAFRAVGYRQAVEYLEGRIGYDEFRMRSIFATRQLAKRQLTWLRGELDARMVPAGARDTESTTVRALADFLGATSQDRP